MGLVSSTEISRTGQYDGNGIRTYTRTFRVIVDDPNEGPFSVAAYVGFNFGDTWGAGETDVTAYLRSASSAPVAGENDYVWEVVFNYSNAPSDQGVATTGSEPGVPSGNPGQANANVAPADRPWLVSLDQVESNVPLLYDKITNEPIVASNGQPFDPPVEVSSYMTQLTFTGYKNIGDDGYFNSASFTNKINSDTYFGFGARTLLVKKYGLVSQYDNGQFVWSKSVVLLVNLDKWNPIKVLDQGTHYIPSDTSKPPQPILDLTGNPASTPMPLDGFGWPLSCTEILAGNYEFLEYSPYKEVSFASLL